MNDTMQNAINVEIAKLVRTVVAPSGDLGFGSDISCTSDTDARFSEVSGGTVNALGQALYRRLTTFRGTLRDDDDYGLITPLQALVNTPMTPASLARIGDNIALECAKDERVASTSVIATYTAVAKALDITIKVTPRDPKIFPFKFVISVTDAGALLSVIGSGA